MYVYILKWKNDHSAKWICEVNIDVASCMMDILANSERNSRRDVKSIKYNNYDKCHVCLKTYHL